MSAFKVEPSKGSKPPARGAAGQSPSAPSRADVHDHDHGHDAGHGHDHDHDHDDSRPAHSEPAPWCATCDPPDTQELQQRSTAIRRVFWITLVFNFAVAAGKGLYSLLSGSVTLGADAFHS